MRRAFLGFDIFFSDMQGAPKGHTRILWQIVPLKQVAYPFFKSKITKKNARYT